MRGFASDSSKMNDEFKSLLQQIRRETTSICHDTSLIIEIELIVEKAETGEMPIEIAAYRLGRVKVVKD